VQFVSARQGWVVGAGHVLATTDGGQTWAQQYSGPAQLDQVDFVDARNGWAVGLTSLLRTTDGGATWAAAQDPCQSIRSVHFVTPDLGYAVAGGSRLLLDSGLPAPATGGQLLTTTDGGQHWLTVAGAPAQVQTACFTTATTGYVGTPGEIWGTSDGGGHWTLAFAEPAAAAGAGHQGTPDTTVLQCAGSGAAGAAGAAAAWVLFRGSGAALGHAPYLAYAISRARPARALFEEAYIESAVRPQVHAPDGPGSYPGPFSVVSQDSAVFAGFDPAAGYGAVPLMAVTAAGLTRAGDVAGISQAYGIAFVSDTRGWAVGENMRTGEYAVEATTDAGRTWSRQYQAR
jgi:photosystem II stability/assembly factor-like uncharacterized protein